MQQFLTAVFELRPSKRKAAVLEHVRSRAEVYFWQKMTDLEKTVDDKIKAKEFKSQLSQEAVAYGFPESIATGLARDLAAARSSYIELKKSDQNTEWPTPIDTTIIPTYAERLEQFAFSLTEEEENANKNELLKEPKFSCPRPFTLPRERDSRIVRDKNGRLAAVLNVLSAKDKRSKETVIHEGTDATTGEALKKSKRKTIILLPLSCSKWHENKFLSGHASLKSSLIIRRNDRWFLAAQFEFNVADIATSGLSIGVDRGVVNPIAMSVVDEQGGVIEVLGGHGKQIKDIISQGRKRIAEEQKRYGKRLTSYIKPVDHILHKIANDIVGYAKKHRANVVMEDLSSQKSTITTKRQTGERKNGWRTVLKSAQLGKLEQILAYKLAMNGLPPVTEIFAANTSITCSACGHVDKENRIVQHTFSCVSCGHELNADDNASIIIARRGILFRAVKKGDKMDTLHKNMVSHLKMRDDNGLGPLAELGQRVVAAHSSKEDHSASMISEVEKVTLFDQNALAYSQSGSMTKERASFNDIFIFEA